LHVTNSIFYGTHVLFSPSSYPYLILLFYNVEYLLSIELYYKILSLKKKIVFFVLTDLGYVCFIFETFGNSNSYTFDLRSNKVVAFVKVGLNVSSR